jgi:hypothetical protein
MSSNGAHPSSSGRRAPATAAREDLDALTKQELLRLAENVELDGRSAMNKPDLLDALSKQRLPWESLTKQDLLTIGEEKGAEVRSSMTKSELIDLIRSPAH